MTRSMTPAGGDLAWRNPSLAEIQAFQHVVQQMPNQVQFEVRHHFTENAYLRELLVPAGGLVIGKLHKTRHILLITCGLIECMTDDGMKLLRAGDIVETMPGTKRVLLAHEYTRMVTVHVTQETDLARLEAAIIEPEPELALATTKAIGAEEAA